MKNGAGNFLATRCVDCGGTGCLACNSAGLINVFFQEIVDAGITASAFVWRQGRWNRDTRYDKILAVAKPSPVPPPAPPPAIDPDAQNDSVEGVRPNPSFPGENV